MTLTGKQAPTFTLPNYDGVPFTLTPGEGGVPIALFFFPKSGSFVSSGATEAGQFRTAITRQDNFKPNRIKIIGISVDDPESQKAFVKNNELPFPVLSDENGIARDAYEVGKGTLGARDARTTFIIDGEGIVRDSYESDINIPQHTKFVDKWIYKLEGVKHPKGLTSGDSSVSGIAVSSLGSLVVGGLSALG